MIRFNNDYNHGAHPAILEALARTNDESFPGYGHDDVCHAAAELIRAQLGESGAEAGSDEAGSDAIANAASADRIANAAIHFLVGGTQTNLTFIDHVLRPWESAICADSAHINVHETGAIEHNGHKIEAALSRNGKISAEAVRRLAIAYQESPVQEHITKPRLVFIASPTEVGSLYTKKEIEALRVVCDDFGLYLFVDGARMAYGLGSPENDMTLADFARLTDAFWVGGTKCGTLFGEALVIMNPTLQECFRASIKQNGALLAKGWLLGLQFETMFRDGLYFQLGAQACTHALCIRDAFVAAGIPLHAESPTNQQFVVLTPSQANQLAQDFVFEPEGETEDGNQIVRFCTSWATTQEEVDALVTAIEKL